MLLKSAINSWTITLLQSCVLLVIGLSWVKAETLHLAVAANFYPTAKNITQAFEKATGHQVVLIAGSTGKLQAQILHGAPVDIFMAADDLSIDHLLKNAIGLAETRQIYAKGRIALYSTHPQIELIEGRGLVDSSVEHIAIANPKLAPYGRAALEFLHSMKNENVLGKIVQGENVAQAFHLVSAGAAQVGVVAWSQVLTQLESDASVTYWLVPSSLHKPIAQELMVLKKNPLAFELIEFLKQPLATQIIVDAGYGQ